MNEGSSDMTHAISAYMTSLETNSSPVLLTLYAHVHTKIENMPYAIASAIPMYTSVFTSSTFFDDAAMTSSVTARSGSMPKTRTTRLPCLFMFSQQLQVFIIWYERKTAARTRNTTSETIPVDGKTFSAMQTAVLFICCI